jgi:hypothetical protein
MSIDLKSEVLQGVAVLDGIGGVGLGQLKYTRVLADAVVLDVSLTDGGHVKKTVEEVAGPVEVGRAVGDSPAVAAHTLKRATELVRWVANHSFAGSVGTTPVTSPS